MSRIFVINNIILAHYIATILANNEHSVTHNNQEDILLSRNVKYNITNVYQQIQHILPSIKYYIDYNQLIKITKQAKHLSLNQLASSLNLKIHNLAITEIYLPINQKTYYYYKLLHQLFPNAKFIFYLEGLLSYIIASFNHKIYNLTLTHDCYFIDYNTQLTALLNTTLPQSRIYYLNTKILKQQLILQQQRFLKSNYNADNFFIIDQYLTSNQPAILMLPQYYETQMNNYDFKQLTHRYLQHIKHYLALDIPVIMKLHHHANNHLYDYLSMHINNKHFYLLKTDQQPIEYLTLNNHNLTVFSVYSTSLMNLSLLNQVNIATDSQLLLQRIKQLKKSFDYKNVYLCALVAQVVPELDYLDNVLANHQHFKKYLKQFLNPNLVQSLTFKLINYLTT